MHGCEASRDFVKNFSVFIVFVIQKRRGRSRLLEALVKDKVGHAIGQNLFKLEDGSFG